MLCSLPLFFFFHIVLNPTGCVNRKIIAKGASGKLIDTQMNSPHPRNISKQRERGAGNASRSFVHESNRQS